MNKTTTTKTKPLTLKKETVKNLTADMLKQVAGGAIPITKQSHCPTACTNC